VQEFFPNAVGFTMICETEISKWNQGVRGGAVVWGTTLQAGRLRVWFPMQSLGFLIDFVIPAALRPWGRLSL
jgi:hypothetical protein